MVMALFIVVVFCVVFVLLRFLIVKGVGGLLVTRSKDDRFVFELRMRLVTSLCMCRCMFFADGQRACC